MRERRFKQQWWNVNIRTITVLCYVLLLTKKEYSSLIAHRTTLLWLIGITTEIGPMQMRSYQKNKLVGTMSSNFSWTLDPCHPCQRQEFLKEPDMWFADIILWDGRNITIYYHKILIGQYKRKLWEEPSIFHQLGLGYPTNNSCDSFSCVSHPHLLTHGYARHGTIVKIVII